MNYSEEQVKFTGSEGFYEALQKSSLEPITDILCVFYHSEAPSGIKVSIQVKPTLILQNLQSSKIQVKSRSKISSQILRRTIGLIAAGMSSAARVTCGIRIVGQQPRKLSTSRRG